MRTSSALCCLDPTNPLLSQAVTTFEQALESQSVPGSNLKGSVDGANWCFLLPSLELGRVLAVGCPAPSSLATLSKLGDEVLVWADDERRFREILAKRSLRNVSTLSADPGRALPLPDDDVDIVVLAEPCRARSDDDRYELGRVLKPAGLVYAESRLPLARHRGRRGAGPPLDGPPGREVLWAAPAWGELRFAAPAGDGAATAYLEKRFLKPLLRRRLLKAPGMVAARTPLANRVVRRRATVVREAVESPLTAPPAYIRAIASEARVAIEGLRWAFAAPGAYSSQKALFFLFDDRATEPRCVVKITRDGRHNPRLENEWQALRLLQERGIGDERTRPSPLFYGHHAGLAIVGETAVVGRPFLERTQASHGCPHARQVVEWLLDLGVSTAHPASDPSLVVGRLRALLARFEDLYRPDGETTALLESQLAMLAANADDMRLVFQHGDPGPWNLVVTADGEPGFLDWEAADPDGMPLWDLFHFLRSFGLAVSQKAGTRDPNESFADQVLATSGLNRLLVETARRFCHETGFSTRLVEPLFYLCWVHRAVKEASRLTEEELQSGRYVNLLRVAVTRRDAPGLQRLFSPPVGV
jgi:SAM-dependent methyltransferase